MEKYLLTPQEADYIVRAQYLAYLIYWYDYYTKQAIPFAEKMRAGEWGKEFEDHPICVNKWNKSPKVILNGHHRIYAVRELDFPVPVWFPLTKLGPDRNYKEQYEELKKYYEKTRLFNDKT